MPPRIFISYRRDDAAGEAGRLADHLNLRFGEGQVFLDIDTIDPGKDFVQVLQASLRETGAVLVVIGSRWASARDASGARRLDDAKDFVRLEVEAALGRDIPVVPVLVQGATIPRTEDLPPSIVSLSARQAVTLDHAEFRDDVHRLGDQLEKLIGSESIASLSADVQALVGVAMALRRRQQFDEALATLARARAVAKSSATVREAQEDVAMEWIRDVKGKIEKRSIGEVLKPAIAIVDVAVQSATGQRRADLLAHQGWATFLLRQAGETRLNPAEIYREALSIDPVNPYANAMLAHWTLNRDHDDLAIAVELFNTALRTGRASDVVSNLQWAAYDSSIPKHHAECVRLVDAMRRAGEPVSRDQADRLWTPYHHAVTDFRSADVTVLLDALPADDYIATFEWAFKEYDRETPLMIIRFYVALLEAKAGRIDQAIAGLTGLTNAGSWLGEAAVVALDRLRSR